MEFKDLIFFALAGGVSGLIAYRTFRWAYYEEIGPGLAAVFLAFSLLVFVAITNYEAIRHWRMPHPVEAETAAQAIQKATKRSLHLIQEELQRQRSTLSEFTRQANELEEKGVGKAEKAEKLARTALAVAEETRNLSERFNAIQASASWETLIQEFYDIELYLRRWEGKNRLLRGGQVAASMEDVKAKLRELTAFIEIPEAIRTLYLKRQRKYEILSKLKEELRLLPKGGVRMADFNLPPPPELPSTDRLGQRLPLPGSGWS